MQLTASPNWLLDQPPSLVVDGNLYHYAGRRNSRFRVSGSTCELAAFQADLCGLGWSTPPLIATWSMEAAGLELDPRLDAKYVPPAVCRPSSAELSTPAI